MVKKFQKIRQTPTLAITYSLDLLKALFRTLLLTGLSVIILYPLLYSLSIAMRPRRSFMIRWWCLSPKPLSGTI